MQNRAAVWFVEVRNVLGLTLACVGVLVGSSVYKISTRSTKFSVFYDISRLVPVPGSDVLLHKDPLDLERLAEEAVPSPPPPPSPALRVTSGESRVLKKETLSGILRRIGLSASEGQKIVKAFGKEKVSLKAGQKFSYTLIPQGRALRLQYLTIPTEFGKEVRLDLRKGGTYRFKKVSLPLIVTTQCVRGAVRTNVMADAVRVGVPKEIAQTIPEAFGSLINVKHYLHPGDRFEVFFDRMGVKGSREKRPGKLLYVGLLSKRAKEAVYRFPEKEGHRFYTTSAESVQRGRFGWPISGARTTSGFGPRRHPISGRSRWHRGVDLSAPQGTPVSASAEGVVKCVVSGRGYGRCVTLGHLGGYETLYAHLSQFAKGIRPGSYVRSGQVVGFVGRSGSATGSHLHYEVHLHGKPIDPSSVRLLAVQKLSGKDLRRFQEFKRSVDTAVRRVAL
ncbi:MAG: peptidoglycan DD-metalloendopeptidase family protein [Holosporales bacterium]|nr:peptidoglycan DD-metalloendopeptidase family protein [Holosporales bacterium]